MDPKVSIILPTYNVARYLLNCLDSINKQTYTNYEVIIVVDGASDGSYELAKEYCSAHEKFQFFWQENAGSGPARNNGIEHSSGDLVMFIDPDDWISSDHVKNLVDKQVMGNFDLTASYRTAVYFDKNENEIKRVHDQLDNYECIEPQILHRNYYKYRHLITDPTCKLYKLSIIKKNNIKFPELRRSQDIVFNYRYYEHINSFAAIPISDYYYRIIFSERISRIRPDYYKTIIYMYNDLKQMHKRLKIDFPIKEASNIEHASIVALLESYTINNLDYNIILKEPTIAEIVANANPAGVISKIRHYIIRMGNPIIIKIFFTILIRIKNR